MKKIFISKFEQETGDGKKIFFNPKHSICEAKGYVPV